MNPQPFVDVLRAELVQARLKAGLTQAELAERIGVQQGTLSAWEAGRYMPSAGTLVRWADGLGMDVVLIPREDGAP